ncbi:uncharacterized protein LOC100371878 [Saccoglossus kowalevskii]|uniref:CBL-interacting protein kinase 20-like n=1 Tax=Saccoglossus kowalevskii TaxID=10224 RepID=A0ABM0GT23_SACKO|nr:PREDICTED: CBL-interacting protein kinase 20-like [Saccoglossus kowalevskii]
MKKIQLQTIIEGLLTKYECPIYQLQPNDIWLGDQLSNGGQSKVCEAVVKVGGEEMHAVIKIIKDDEELEYAVQEIDLLCECQELLNSVVKILGLTIVPDEDENGKRTYRLGIVLERGDHDLATHLERYTGSHSVEVVLEIFYSVVQMVQSLHSQGIAHRDLKLENILVKGEQLKILDLGLATKTERYYEAEMHTICGTKGYDAPEICLGEMDGETVYEPKSVDFFSLGVMLFSMLLDRTKHSLKKCQKAISHATKRLDIDRVIDKCVRDKLICGDHPELIDLIRNLIDPDPYRRLTNARVLLNKLQKIMRNITTGNNAESDYLTAPVPSRLRTGKENEINCPQALKAFAANYRPSRPKRLQERNRSRSPKNSGKGSKQFTFCSGDYLGKRPERCTRKHSWA